MKKERMTQAAESATEDIFPSDEEIVKIIKDSAEVARKVGRPTERGETYRFSLYLDSDLKNFIKFASWKRRLSKTQYLNALVREDMQAYLEAGGSADEWEDED